MGNVNLLLNRIYLYALLLCYAYVYLIFILIFNILLIFKEESNLTFNDKIKFK
jgi:hypothetical protein